LEVLIVSALIQVPNTR